MKKVYAMVIIGCILLAASGCEVVEVPPSSTAEFPTEPVPTVKTSTVVLTEAERELYSDGSEDYIFRIYQGQYDWDGYERSGDVAVLLQSASEYFVRIARNAVSYSDKCHENDKIEEVWRYLVHPDHVFGLEVEVYDMYCLANVGGDGNPRIVIYTTNIGDYVLAFRYSFEEPQQTRQYLFTIEEFCRIRNNWAESEVPVANYFAPIEASSVAAEQLEEGMSYGQVVERLGVTEAYSYRWDDDVIHLYWELDNGKGLGAIGVCTDNDIVLDIYVIEERQWILTSLFYDWK